MTSINTTPVLTAAQEKRRAAIERRLRRALHDAEALAIEAGCDPDDVELYLEPGAVFHVMSGEAMEYTEQGSVLHTDREVFRLECDGAIYCPDCGGW